MAQTPLDQLFRRADNSGFRPDCLPLGVGADLQYRYDQGATVDIGDLVQFQQQQWNFVASLFYAF